LVVSLLCARTPLMAMNPIFMARQWLKVDG
jgi:hypothetical protein